MLSPSLNNLNLRKEKRNKQIITTIIANNLLGNKEKNKFKLRKKKGRISKLIQKQAVLVFLCFPGNEIRGRLKCCLIMGNQEKKLN